MTEPVLRVALLVAAGVGSGLAGSVAGLASLVSYPALLATGLAPLAANVTNTVALVFSSAGSISASRPELVGQRALLRRLAPVAVLGGAAGGVLLLLTPGGAFARVVPWLIGGASLAILWRPDPARVARLPRAALPVGIFLVGVYGGYFGAAAGVLLLALVLVTTGEPLARANAAKNVLLGVANAVAAVGFALFGPVHWTAVVPLAAGLFVGGRLGPVVVRRAPPTALRLAVAAAGVALAVVLGIQAYG